MKVTGMITAMVTPMKKGGEIDYVATRKLVNRLIEKGVDGIFILGTNGEFHCLGYEEKIMFTKEVVSYVKGRVPVYAGAGSNSTNEAIQLSHAFALQGVQAVSIITPYLIPLSQEELQHHYVTIADHVSIPVILYNIPKNTGNNLDPETVSSLSKHKNIMGIKDSSGNLEQIKAYIENTKEEDFCVLSGSDSLILKSLQLGATGAIAATSNLLTDIDVAIYQSFLDGNIKVAKQKQDDIEELRHVLKMGSVPAILKEAMNMAGITVGDARQPAQVPSDEVRKKIDSMLQHYNLEGDGKHV